RAHAPNDPDHVYFYDEDGAEAIHPEKHPLFHPLDQPRWKPASDASHMRPDDPVIGYWNGKEAWALPWWILKNHHVANLELGGQPMVITLCEVCSSSSAFVPVVDGRRLHFRVTGIYDGTICISDDETHTSWRPFVGVGISGTYARRELERLRLDQA